MRRAIVTIAALVAAAGISYRTITTLADEPSRTDVRVDVRANEETADVELRGTFSVPTYAIRSREEGRVVAIDLEGASIAPDAVRSTTSGLVLQTSASTTATGIQIEIRTSRPVTYRARATDQGLTVRIEAIADDTTNDDSDTEARSSGPLSVRDVNVERRDGRERVVVELSRPAPFRVVPGQSGPARLEIEGASVAPNAAPTVPQDARSVVRGVRVRDVDGRAVIEVERSEGTSTTAVREGNRIVWLFAPGAERDTRPRSETIAVEPGFVPEEELHGDDVASFLSDMPLQIRANRGQRTYHGRRIELDFKDADILNILRLLAEVGGVNIVAGDDVTGQVTIRMRNVPWDQALDVILQAKGLGMVRRANLIRVAPLTTLEKERELAIARQKQQVELAQLDTRLVPVSYATAEDLRDRVRELLSSRGTVSVDERTNVLIVRDVAENLDEVEDLVRRLDTQTPQVLVEARIVEASSQYSRDVGIQWGGDITLNQATGNPTGLIFPSNVGITGGNYDTNTPSQGLSPLVSSASTPNFAVNLPATTGTGVGGALGITLGNVGGTVNLAVRLSAAEASGSLRIISSPRILTLDNAEAHISQGTLIPYSQISAQGVQTAFQEAKLELRVRPHVTSDGSIAMHVRVTRDEPDFTRTSARGDPTILKREAETDLLIADGHTAVIGGIYTRTQSRNVNQVPFFGDIPILGVLFQRRRVQDQRSELLIFLTPRIVNRAAAVGR